MKIGSSYSLWNEIKRGVPQWSILGALLFYTFINDIFTFIEICNFADDNTIYGCGKDLSDILENLKHNMNNLLHGHRNGISSVAFEVLVMNCKIGFKILLISNYLALNISLLIFNSFDLNLFSQNTYISQPEENEC